jgi:preprotein translocase subunit SecY
MTSVVEQFASGVRYSNFAKADDLKARLWFTLLALIVYRFGTYIPLPGINPEIMAEVARQNSGGIFAIFDMFSGGALQRMTVFALNIMPYISASIIVQLLTAVFPHFEALRKEGESGRKKLNQYTRYGTVLLGIMQAYGISVGLEHMHSGTSIAVVDPGFVFRITSVLTLVTGTLFLVWLGEQITARGVGNGTSLIIFSGIVANLPSSIVAMLELGRTGALSVVFILFIVLMLVGVIAFIVFMERAQRRIYIQYPKRQVGTKLFGGESSHMPLKINSSGVIPPIFANSILLLPITIASLAAKGSGIMASLSTYLAHGQPVYIALYVAFIVFFSFFYTSIVFNPEETAENLRKHGGIIPGIRPGASTAEYFDYVMTRLTVIGAAYLAFICVLPELLIAKYALPFYFGGTSILIVVGVTIDTISQIQAHLISHQYEGLLRKGAGKGMKK